MPCLKLYHPIMQRRLRVLFCLVSGDLSHPKLLISVRF
jgi:hypothetical protein